MRSLDETTAEDQVFNNGASNDHDEADVDSRQGRLFEATPEELHKEENRKHDRRVGLLIGPKNLEKLRAFGYDVAYVQAEPLTPGVAHRGLTG